MTSIMMEHPPTRTFPPSNSQNYDSEDSMEQQDHDSSNNDGSIRISNTTVETTNDQTTAAEGGGGGGLSSSKNAYLQAKCQNGLYSDLSFVGNEKSTDSTDSEQKVDLAGNTRNTASDDNDDSTPHNNHSKSDKELDNDDDIRQDEKHEGVPSPISVAAVDVHQNDTFKTKNISSRPEIHQVVPSLPVVPPTNKVDAASASTDTTVASTTASSSGNNSNNSSMSDLIAISASGGMSHYFKKTQQHLHRDLQRSQERIAQLEQNIQAIKQDLLVQKGEDSNQKAQCSALLDEMIEYEAQNIKYQLRVTELTNELSHTQSILRDLQENLKQEQTLGKELDMQGLLPEKEKTSSSSSSSSRKSLLGRGRRSLGLLGSFHRSSHRKKNKEEEIMPSPYDLGGIPEQQGEQQQEIVEKYVASVDDATLDFENDDDTVLSAWTTMSSSPTGGAMKKSTSSNNPKRKNKAKSSSKTNTKPSSRSSSSSWLQTENSVADSYDELRELRHDMTLLRLKKEIEKYECKQKHHRASTSTLRKDIVEIELENSALMIKIQQYQELLVQEEAKEENQEEEEGSGDIIEC